MARALALLLCAACTGGAATGAPDAGPIAGGPDAAPEPVRVLAAVLPAGTPTRDLDILFVVDNSTSMAPKQAALTANFQRFMDVLQAFPGGMPNVHIGVVSSDVGIGGFTAEGCVGSGDDGLLQNRARGACTPPTDRYISDVAGPGGRVTNYSGKLADAFTCIAQLGTLGCGY